MKATHNKDIETLSKDGFFLNKINSGYSDIAFLALRSSLVSYFQTSINLNWLLSDSLLEKMDEKQKDEKHGIQYASNSSNAILHFHHFVELILKDILRSINTLLAVDASDKPILLYKLIQNESISETDKEGLKQIEFKTALDRVVALIKDKKLDDSYKFIQDSQRWLEKINSLRNRISHRGVFILRYNALDELFGKYIFPFIIKITSLPQYNDILMHQLNMCNDNINPIKDIITEYSNNKIDHYKIQLLKLLGNASYKNPIISYNNNMFSFIYDNKIKHARLIADIYAKEEHYYKRHTCPVCGIDALVPEFDSYEEYNDDGEIINCIDYVYKVKCHFCSFELENYIINRIKGFKIKIEDYSNITR